MGMRNIIQYRIFKSDTHYVAEGLDLPVVTQGKTLDELTKNIQEATELCLDGEDPADFGLAPSSPVLVNFELPRSLAHA
jgi:predicted RNase H-like HicB family nuclease